MKNLDILSSSADTIHDETHENLNSAIRVGGLFQDIVDWLKEFNRRTDGASGIPAATLDNTYLYYNLGNYSWVTISGGSGSLNDILTSLNNSTVGLPSSGPKALLYTPGTGWSWGTSGGGGLDANAVWLLLSGPNGAKWWGKSFPSASNHVISGDLKDVGKIKITKPDLNYFEIEYDPLKEALKFNGSIYATGSVSSLGYSSGGGGGGTSLNSFLTQLNADNPDLTNAEGKYLYYNGSKFIMQTVSSGGGGASSLNDLSDVEINNPSANQILQYTNNGGGYKWRNVNGGSSSSGLTSFTISTPQTGHLRLNSDSISVTINSSNTGLIIKEQDNYQIPSTTEIGNWNTLLGYFNPSGVANSAAALSGGPKTAWGQLYLNSSGYPLNVKGLIEDLKQIKFIDKTPGALDSGTSINFYYSNEQDVQGEGHHTSNINEASAGRITINDILGVAKGTITVRGNTINPGYTNTVYGGDNSPIKFRIALGLDLLYNVLVPAIYTLNDIVIRYGYGIKAQTVATSGNSDNLKLILAFGQIESRIGLYLGHGITNDKTVILGKDLHFETYVTLDLVKRALTIDSSQNLLITYGKGLYCRNYADTANLTLISLITEGSGASLTVNVLRIGDASTKTVISGAGGNSNINFRIGQDTKAKVTSSGVLIGEALLQWDSEKSSLKLTKADGTLANFYALGGISCLGMTANSSGTIDSATINTLTSSKLLMSDGAGGGCDISVYASAITNVVDAGDAKVFLFKSYGSSSNRYTVFNTPVIGGTIANSSSITSNWVINLDGSCIFKDFKIYTTLLELHFLYMGSRVRLGLDFNNGNKLTVFRKTSNTWNAVAVLE